MDNKKIFLFPLFLTILSSCNFLVFNSELDSSEDESFLDSDSESNNEQESEVNSEEIESEKESESEVSTSESETPEKTIFENFFEHSNNVELILDFSKYNNSIQKLASYGDNNAGFTKNEMYHPLDVTVKINGVSTTYLECGARMKGNTSRDPNFVSNSGQINSLVHFKISFNQTFDDVEDNDYYVKTWEDSSLRKERKNRRFGHVKKFDLKWNKCDDGTFTKQAYAYEAFRNEGILVERNNLIKTTIKTSSDSYTTTYLAQECVDKEFLKYHLGDNGAGNLYKATYTSNGPADYTLSSLNRVGIESDYSKPSYDLKTNDDEPNHDLLNNFVKNLNNDKRSANEFKSILDQLIDPDYMLKYHAISYLMGNPDDSRMNYNNHYIYFNSSNNKAYFIPYDFDRCLGILHTWDKDMTSLWPTSTKDIDRNWQKNPLLWRLFLNETDSAVSYSDNYPVIQEYKNKYKEYILEYGEKYLDVNKFQAFTNEFYYAPSKNVNSAGGTSPSNQTFAYYAANKKNAISEDTRL